MFLCLLQKPQRTNEIVQQQPVAETPSNPVVTSRPAHHARILSVVADTVADPFVITTVGNINVIGNTVFGPGLEENSNSFAEVMAEVDTTRLAP